MALNLKATNEVESAILAYLEQNASEALTEKINKGKKTLSQCVSYLISQAKKGAGSAIAAVASDETVYGWAVHFFEEDSVKPGRTEGVALTSGKKGDSCLMMKGSPNVKEIREAKATLDRMEAAATGKDVHPDKPQSKIRIVKQAEPKKNAAEIEGQTNIFDFLGG